MKKTLFTYLLIFIAGLFVVKIINDFKSNRIKFKNDSSSTIWLNINEDLFYKNINENISSAVQLYQGSGTNLCGHAAITYYLIKHEPKIYQQMVLDLYKTGKTVTPSKELLAPSSNILEYTGTLKNNGVLDINHADQLWFLTLADQYKGYVNIFNWAYDYGDESTTWASTNLNKFNRIWSAVTGKEVNSIGSDLIRPSIDNYEEFLINLKQDHSIMLYLNNTVLTKTTFSSITFPIPTHFLELYDIQSSGEYYILEYWDYGLKTKEIIEKEKFKSIIYGISYMKKN